MIRGLCGLAMVLVGSAALLALIAITWSATPMADSLLMHIGLAGSAAISGVAQGLILIGAWLLWTATHPGVEGRWK